MRFSRIDYTHDRRMRVLRWLQASVGKAHTAAQMALSLDLEPSKIRRDLRVLIEAELVEPCLPTAGLHAASGHEYGGGRYVFYQHYRARTPTDGEG